MEHGDLWQLWWHKPLLWAEGWLWIGVCGGLGDCGVGNYTSCMSRIWYFPLRGMTLDWLYFISLKCFIFSLTLDVGLEWNCGVKLNTSGATDLWSRPVKKFAHAWFNLLVGCQHGPYCQTGSPEQIVHTGPSRKTPSTAVKVVFNPPGNSHIVQFGAAFVVMHRHCTALLWWSPCVHDAVSAPTPHLCSGALASGPTVTKVTKVKARILK